MRWLIVGPYPPEQGSGPAAAAAAVAARLSAGDSVHAVSPRPSAAHAHQPLEGARAMWALARLARAEKADGLWLRIEPGILLCSGTDRGRALLDRLALAALLRRFRTSVLDVGDVGLLPGGRAGGVVFSSAEGLIAHTEADAARLVANGAPAAKVRLQVLTTSSEQGASESPATSDRALEEPIDLPPATGLRGLSGARGEIEAAIRARAAEIGSARRGGPGH